MLAITTTTTSETEAALLFLNELFRLTPLQEAGFKLWDGTLWPDERPRQATLVLRHPGALREMFSAGTEKALAEAFLRDDFDIEGDIEAAFEIADVLAHRQGGWLKSLRS